MTKTNGDRICQALPKQHGALGDLLVLALVPIQWFCPTITEGLRGNCLLSHPGSWPGWGEFSGHLSSGLRTEEAGNGEKGGAELETCQEQRHGDCHWVV